MPVRTVVNREFVRDVVWQLRVSLNTLNDEAGLSPSYIYQIAPSDDGAEPKDVSLSTVDKLHNAIERLMLDRNINPPDDLWQRLIVHEEG